MADSQHTDESNYGYTPSAAWCLVFIVLFSLSGLVHCVQAWRSKYWIIYPTLVLGALTEVLGWSARYWSSQNVLLLTPFLMQISTLIIAPVFFSAYCYAVLGTAIHKLGAQYSILRANWYFIIFITADVISLVLQAIGGGKASASAATGAPTQSATNIMVAGIIFQLVTMGVFIACGIDFCLRAQLGRPYAFQVRRLERLAAQQAQWTASKGSNGTPTGLAMAHSDGSSTVTAVADPEIGEKVPRSGAAGSDAGEYAHKEHLGRWWLMMLAVGIASAMIFIRGIYRSIELVQGWSGYLITHQIYQNVLDGIPMFIAVAIFNLFNPGYLLPKKAKWGPYY